MTEDRNTKIKRLKMRSMRRGIKEMDLIFSAYADRHVADLNDTDLATYDALLSENDHDIYGWITNQGGAPDVYAPIMAIIMDLAAGLTRPR